MFDVSKSASLGPIWHLIRYKGRARSFSGVARFLYVVLLRTYPCYFHENRRLLESLVTYPGAFLVNARTNVRLQTFYECIKLNVLGVGWGIISRLKSDCN